MDNRLPIRCGLALAVLLLGGASWLAGQTVPAKPSAAVSTLPAAQPTGAMAQPGAAPAGPSANFHRVEVNYTDGKLAVQATNASLNEILREVSRKTGMKITGGVEDDRVFGSYGPAAPGAVLDALLDGTGSNILLVNDFKGGMELILTPRHGGASPPNPNAERQANEAEESGGAGYVPPIRPYQPPQATGRGQFVTGADSQLTPPGGGTSAAPGSDQAPTNGTKTPQEIYEQLQQTMQQQRHLNAPPQ